MNYLSFKNASLILTVLLFSIIYFNCDDSGTALTTSTDFCITGKITSWSLGKKNLHAYIKSSNGGSYSVANTQVDSLGNFSLCMPQTISDTTLYSADSLFYSGCGGGNVVFDPADARGSEVSSFKIKDGTQVIGYIKCKNYTAIYPGAYYLKYIWVNKNVSVYGSKVCFGDTLIFNGSAAFSWNKVSVVYSRVSTTSGSTINYTMNEPGGAEWKYYSY